MVALYYWTPSLKCKQLGQVLIKAEALRQAQLALLRGQIQVQEGSVTHL
ncbi:MAG: hypothetical protein AB1589_07850 [Cyanobacteriota bacterium]